MNGQRGGGQRGGGGRGGGNRGGGSRGGGARGSGMGDGGPSGEGSKSILGEMPGGGGAVNRGANNNGGNTTARGGRGGNRGGRGGGGQRGGLSGSAPIFTTSSSGQERGGTAGEGHIPGVQQEEQKPQARIISAVGIEAKISPSIVDRDLAFLPFFPSDNESTRGSGQTLEVLKLVEEGLDALLSMPLHKFWSQVLHDESLSVFLDTFLRYCSRGHAALREDEGLSTAVSSKVLLVLLRLSSCAGFGDLEPDRERLSPSVHASLIYDRFVFDAPKLLDVCSVFSSVDAGVAERVVANVFNGQPKYWDDFSAALPFVCDALNTSSSRLLSLAESASSSSSASADPITDAFEYLSDSSFSMLALIRIFPACTASLHEHGVHTALARAYRRLTTCLRKHKSLQRILSGDHVSFARACLLDAAGGIIQHVHITPLESGAGDAAYGLEATITAMTRGFDEEDGDGDAFMEDLVIRHDLVSRVQSLCALQRTAAAQAQLHEACVMLQLASGGDQVIAPGSRERAEAGGSHALAAEIASVRDVFPDLGPGFVLKCLEEMGGSVERVVQCLLEESLPQKLVTLPRDMPLTPLPGAEPAAAGRSLLSGRANVFDGDAFDVLGGAIVDKNKVHIKGMMNEPASRLLNDKNSDEAIQIKERTQAAVYRMEIDELRREVEAAEEAVMEGRPGAGDRLQRAMSRLQDAESELLGDHGHAHNVYDDEYDDSYDEFGIMSLGERTAESEESGTAGAAGLSAAAVKRVLAKQASQGSEEEDESKMWDQGNMNRGLEGVDEDDDELDDGPSAARKEHNKAAIGNHHRRDRAARKLRAVGLPG